MNITLPSNVLARAFKAVVLSASRDDYRAHLSSVWIRALPNRAPYIWATNGHWISCCRLDEATVETPGLVGTAVDDVKRLVALMPQKPMGLTVSNDGKASTFDLSGYTKMTVKSIDATPPPVHSIVPNRLSTKVHQRTALSIEVLGPALQAIGILGKGRRGPVGVRLYAMGPTNLDPQIVWSAQCPEYFALLMPMRTEGKRHEAMRWWHDASADVEAAIVAAKKVETESVAAAE